MSAPRLTFGNDDDLAEVLEGLRAAISSHPIAAQAIFGALVAEGRAYARTPEGTDWLRRLSASDLLERLRVVWGAIGMNSFTEQHADALPSHYLDAALRAARRSGLEELLSTLLGLDG